MATPSMQHYKQQKKVLKHLSKLTKEHFRSVVWGTVWEGHWDKYNSLTINCFNPHIVKRLVKEIEHYNDRHNESNINYSVGGNNVWMKEFKYTPQRGGAGYRRRLDGGYQSNAYATRG